MSSVYTRIHRDTGGDSNCCLIIFCGSFPISRKHPSILTRYSLILIFCSIC
ncbi:hypothetical protein [Sphingobacterium oryzagri]|uniref:hypothetical protein n=1 Tax=Sphingobacterium oryzagri TaxID=3025669 RepID=UPI003D1636B2